jgi:FMN phosphatase YigB (HAD superfamily)
MTTTRAVLFDFSGTLFRLEEDDSWFTGIEVGAFKPQPEILHAALSRLGVKPEDALMIGDSEEADGAASEVGCRFALVDPLPTALRPDGLIAALGAAGVAV